MADYFVASGGSNTAPYDTWAKAATSLQTALTAATGDNDRVILKYDETITLGSSTTYTFAGNIALIAASNDGGSAFTPTPMGSANHIGHTSSAYSITWSGAFRVYMYGITARIAGSSGVGLTLGGTDGMHIEVEDCYFWLDNTNGNAFLNFGTSGASTNGFVQTKNCTFRFGSTGQAISSACETSILGGSVSSAGSAPSVLFKDLSTAKGAISVEGADLSFVTGTLVASMGSGSRGVAFTNCKLGSGVTVLASQTPANKSSARAWVFDCAAGDEHYHLQYHDAFGSLTTATAIYANDGAQYDGTNYCSWKIVTTANASYHTPFVSPWFDVYHDGTSAVTPSIEVLADGAATAVADGDDDVWGEWAYKGTTGSTQTTMVNDRKALAASPATQASGVGLSGWTGGDGADVSYKLQPASTITPAEIGHIRGRVLVGLAQTTVYVDPQTRLA